MKVNINRKFAIIATIGLACVISVILVACGSKAGSDTDDTVQPKAIAATRGTTAETEATTTTTTTEASTSEPEIETKTTETATTTEVITTSEPETKVSAEDNPNGVYPMDEAFTMFLEDYTQQKVVRTGFAAGTSSYMAEIEDGTTFSVYTPNNPDMDSVEMADPNLFKMTDETNGMFKIVVYQRDE